MKKQKMVITLLVTVLLLLILMPNVDAALQSNGSAPTKQLLNNWIVNIRKMEALGAGMGLTETIGNNLVPTTASNNLDVHMEKNTEYGAMAILSASSYGNPNKVASGGTTTGNKTGIVINLNMEVVAAGNNSSRTNENFLKIVPNMQNAAGKYKNIYNYVSSYGPEMIGDAIVETQGWHGGSHHWFDGSYSSTYAWRSIIVRAQSGSLFSYYTGISIYDRPEIKYSDPQYSRAAMVCGEGI